MEHILNTLLRIVSIVAAIAGTVSMALAKIAAAYGGAFLSRSETHWFNDSVTAFLLSIACTLLLLSRPWHTQIKQ